MQQSHVQDPLRYEPESMSHYLQQDSGTWQLEAQVSEAPCLATDSQLQAPRHRSRLVAGELWIYLGLVAASGIMVAFFGSVRGPHDALPALREEAFISMSETQEYCLSDNFPCSYGVPCCGYCIDGMIGGQRTGMCAGNGTYNAGAFGPLQCLPANSSCSTHVDCCGVCREEGREGPPNRKGVAGVCVLQDTWSRKCLPRGEGCSDELACCGHCVYEGADTVVCCDKPKTVSNGSFVVCCDNPDDANSGWCSP